jgi:hypothetical protein
MTTDVQVRNALGALTVRPSDDDLHRAARRAMQAGGHEIFGMLPGILDQIIEYETWKSKFGSFGKYALDPTSDGLGITNNHRLWMLKCALDVYGRHINEWASVLQEVEKCVKVQARKEGKKLRGFDGNSLETLAKNTTDQSQITYLPSYNKNADGQLVRRKRTVHKAVRETSPGRGNEETKLNCAALKFLRLTCPDCLAFHVPNGGLRSKQTARLMSALGTVSGVFDICLLAPGGRCFFLEAKSSKGELSDSQQRFKAQLIITGLRLCRVQKRR